MKMYQVSIKDNVLTVDDVLAEDGESAIQQVLDSIREEGYEISKNPSCHAELISEEEYYE